MMRNRLFVVMILGMLLALLAPIAAHAQITITFEGLDEGDPVGTVDGVVFGEGWRVLLDYDEGGGGSFAHEPSPSTVMFLSGATASAAERRITFPQPMGTVTFFYSLDTSEGAPVVSFYGASSTVIGTVTMDTCGSPLCGYTCSGDPDGSLCSWTELTFNSSKSIMYMEFTSAGAAYYVIDSLTLTPITDYSFNRNGFWVTPEQIGCAIAIDIRGDKLAVGWGAYDEQTGEPAWLYSDGEMTDANHFSGDLYKFGHGQCFNCPYTAPTVQQKAGDITILFHDETSATISALGITKYIEKVE